MVEERAPVRRRRLGDAWADVPARRVFAKLREGFTYAEIAAEEGVSVSRIRQIVSQELQQRNVDSGAEHAKLQLDRLAPAVQLGAQGIASGDLAAISPYLKALDRLDRYQTVAGANRFMTTKPARSSWRRSTGWPRIRHRRGQVEGGGRVSGEDSRAASGGLGRGWRTGRGVCRFARCHRRGERVPGDRLGRLRRDRIFILQTAVTH